MDYAPLVSIIITSYNYERFVSESIESALSQTYPNVELIVVDDGSQDNSRQIIAQYQDRAKVIFKKNGGQASAFNTGFKESNGDIIFFLDSDDTLLPTAVEKVVEKFRTNSVIKVHWPLYETNMDGQKTGIMCPQYPLSEGDLRNIAEKLGPEYCGGPPYSPPTSGNAWSGNFLKQVMPIPEDQFIACTDAYLFLLVPVFGSIAKIEEPLGTHRIHGSNYSRKPMEEYMRENIVRFEQLCHILSKFFHQKGIQVDQSKWPRNSWFHLIDKSVREIEALIPAAEKFILADDNHWRISMIGNRRCIPFLEVEGEFYGNPENDTVAIKEVERQRANGAAAIIFTWTTFWQLDYYKELNAHLKSNYRCLVNNERLLGYALQSNYGNSEPH
jgi:glycosyltransferase involved in cell wall biosynthesis